MKEMLHHYICSASAIFTRSCKLAPSGSLEPPHGAILAHRRDESGHFRSAFAAGQREAQRMEQLPALLAARLLHGIGEFPPSITAPVEASGDGSGILHQKALVVGKLGRIDLAVE